MDRAALIIMAKAPDPGLVKTRLRGHFSDEERLALYVELLEGTVSRLGSVPGADTLIAYTPVGANEYFSKFGLPIFGQEGDDLAVRMHNALAHVLGMGYERAALVGADIPDLGPDIIVKAMGLLVDNDCVFGPAHDGGYYLVALRSPEPGIFEDVPWSSHDTLERTLERVRESGLSHALVDTLSDIDTPADVRRYRRKKK